MSARQNLSTAASAPRVHTEGQRQVAPAGNPDRARPRDPDGVSVDLGADLRSRFPGLLLWVPTGPFGASSAGGDPGTLAARLPVGVRRGLERLFRFDSARPATSLCADASGGPERTEADPDVAGKARGRTGGRRGRRGEVEPLREGNAARRNYFSSVGKPVSALVRQDVSSSRWPGAMGRSQAGALRRRLRRAAALPGQTPTRLD